MAEYRVLVTGSRDWESVAIIWSELNKILREHGSVTVVHGRCPRGADHIADSWAVTLMTQEADIGLEHHPADWDRYGKAAGFRRNAEMVTLGADLCLAFIRNGSRGATHCADLAEKAGITVRRFTADGDVSAT